LELTPVLPAAIESLAIVRQDILIYDILGESLFSNHENRLRGEFTRSEMVELSQTDKKVASVPTQQCAIATNIASCPLLPHFIDFSCGELTSGELTLTDSNQSYVSTSKDGYAVVSFPKELARSHLGDIREAGERIIEELSAKKFQYCLIDLSQLDFIGSSLVASIVRIWKAISERDGQMVVVATNPGTREVLKVTGLNKVWTIAPTMEAGIHALGFSKEAKVVKRERRVLVMVGLISLILAVAVVAVRILPQFSEWPHPADPLVYAILGLALATSGISIFREKGWRFGLTITVFALTLPLLGFFVWHNEYRKPPVPMMVDPDGMPVDPDSDMDGLPPLPQGGSDSPDSTSSDRGGYDSPEGPPSGMSAPRGRSVVPPGAGSSQAGSASGSSQPKQDPKAPSTPPPETNAPETNAPETDSPESDAPETKGDAS
jgi:anti-anti-sigma factor